MKRKSNIFLIAGMIVLLVGAVLSVCHINPWSDYILIAGAALIIIRGAIRTRERDDKPEQPDNEEQETQEQKEE